MIGQAFHTKTHFLFPFSSISKTFLFYNNLFRLRFQVGNFPCDANTLTWTMNAIVMKIEKMNIPPRPRRCSVLLPTQSTRKVETKATSTMTTPIPIVASLAELSRSPVAMKRLVE